jgi:hypothetical protein
MGQFPSYERVIRETRSSSAQNWRDDHPWDDRMTLDQKVEGSNPSSPATSALATWPLCAKSPNLPPEVGRFAQTVPAQCVRLVLGLGDGPESGARGGGVGAGDD